MVDGWRQNGFVEFVEFVEFVGFVESIEFIGSIEFIEFIEFVELVKSGLAMTTGAGRFFMWRTRLARLRLYP